MPASASVDQGAEPDQVARALPVATRVASPRAISRDPNIRPTYDTLRVVRRVELEETSGALRVGEGDGTEGDAARGRARSQSSWPGP